MDEAVRTKEIGRLLQNDRIKLIRQPHAQTFVCVYSNEEPRNGLSTYCYLLPRDDADAFLSELGWNCRSTDFQPHVECVESWDSGQSIREVSYARDGTTSGAQALIRVRSFAGLRPPFPELAEEFRLFHNLYHDTARGIFIHFDTHGREHEVARIKNERIEIHLKFLVEFLRAKQMHLAMQWDGFCRSAHSLEELGLKANEANEHTSEFHLELALFERSYEESDKSFSRLIGKAIISCPGPLIYQNLYNEDDSAFQEFIVGHNEQGGEILDTCNPNVIQSVASRALKPVFFRRTVLSKYFAEPSKYTVQDGRLTCGSQWDLRIDNDHPKYVIVFLKDLGLGLPPDERSHWRSYNILPDGGLSKTAIQRSIHAEFADATMPDLKLKHLYPQVNELWEKKFGWPLWRKPAQEDRYVAYQVHVCLDENQAEFDQQIGLLAKMLIEWLYSDKIKSALKAPPPPRAGSLKYLEQFLLEAGYADSKERIKSLQLIQSLRSKGSAHRKSSEYAADLKAQGLDAGALVESSAKIFTGAVEFAEWLKFNVVA